ncbi:hypothetical protein AN958_08177 [Leucoagaricus sp. SymC.cos]|nr:hypothetical protein AN958_08177 [Leucoagaricus sp. SymC.cos]
MPAKNSASTKNPMKPSDASRIQSTQVVVYSPYHWFTEVDEFIRFKAKAGKDTGSNSFPARAQSSSAKNVNKGVVNPSGGIPSGRSSRVPKTTGASGKSGSTRK